MLFHSLFLAASSLAPVSFSLATPTVADTPTNAEIGVYTISEPAVTSQPDISYSGGQVMANGVNVYAIFYGSHTASTQSIVQKFVEGLGKSDWWSVTTGYTGSNGAITDKVTWAGSYQDDYSMGKNLKSSFFGGSDLEKVIANAIKQAKWPQDTDGIYVVFTASDVAEASRNGTHFPL